ncbi:MAG: ATP-dependent Clp protease proteolytic subunit [Lachnospiraceae bacterium]|nr:ATP-dependent Clp protease proteolytic subunit [Lachnospiraceae bacterium]
MEEKKENSKWTDEEKTKKENEKLVDEKISDYGQVLLDNKKTKTKIQLLSIIGEIEGHENLGSQNKTTKYEHILPQLAAIEDNEEIDGVLILLNTVGGDVEAGLAIAEMIASLSKPTVSLVLGGSHSIGVPLAVSTKYSFIVPTGTMTIHPVRMNGMVIGVTQTFICLEQIQDRILHFVEKHSDISYDRLRSLMLDTRQLVKDVGTVLVGEETVKSGIINEVGGMKEALAHLKQMIEEKK